MRLLNRAVCVTFRRRYLVAALLGAALIAIGSTPWPADRLPLQAELAAQVQAGSGYTVAGKSSTITLLPLPRFDIENVTLAPLDARDEAIVRAEKVSVRLGLWQLLTGRAQAEHVTVHRPRIVWNGPQRPRDLWLMGREHLVAEASRTAARGAALPGGISIVDGTVVAQRSARPATNDVGLDGSRILLRRLNASVNWPSVRRQLDFNATAIWRGEPVDLRIDKLHPASLAAGMPSPIVLRFSAQPVSFSFAGVIAADDQPGLDGLVSLRTGSLARATAWLRMPLTFSRGTGPMAIKSSARLTDEGLSMPDARVELDGGTLEGALAVRRSDIERLLISATLDAATLDFNRLLAPFRLLLEGRGPLYALPGDARDDTANDVDVRLSISRAQFGALEMQNVAAGILVSHGRMEFALNRAEIDSGSVRGRLQLVTQSDGLSARLAGAFESIDTQKTLHRLFGSTPLAGPARGNFTLAGHGKSIRLLAESLNGTISASIDHGQLLGVDLADVIERSRRSPLATALDWRGGRTTFDSIESTLLINGGRGDLAGILNADGIIGRIGGNVDIVQRTLDLQAYVRPVTPMPDQKQDGESDPMDDLGFPIEISGTWDYPIVTPDIRALIERSGAVAPLRPGETPVAPAHRVR